MADVGQLGSRMTKAEHDKRCAKLEADYRKATKALIPDGFTESISTKIAREAQCRSLARLELHSEVLQDDESIEKLTVDAGRSWSGLEREIRAQRELLGLAVTTVDEDA